MVHPDVKGDQSCKALTSHIDLVPTFLSMAGLKVDRQNELAGRPLPGNDLTRLLTNPDKATPNALREAILFTYSGLITNDSELTRFISTVKDKDGGIRAAIRGETVPI